MLLQTPLHLVTLRGLLVAGSKVGTATIKAEVKKRNGTVYAVRTAVVAVAGDSEVRTNFVFGDGTEAWRHQTAKSA